MDKLADILLWCYRFKKRYIWQKLWVIISICSSCSSVEISFSIFSAGHSPAQSEEYNSEATYGHLSKCWPWLWMEAKCPEPCFPALRCLTANWRGKLPWSRGHSRQYNMNTKKSSPTVELPCRAGLCIVNSNIRKKKIPLFKPVLLWFLSDQLNLYLKALNIKVITWNNFS